MKNLPCDICGWDCKAVDFQTWFAQMLGHWKEHHQAEMKEMEETYSKEDGEKWMADHQTAFEAAEEEA